MPGSGSRSARGASPAPAQSFTSVRLMADRPPIPQRLTFVTLGTKDMARARTFYASWGWQESDGGSDEFAQFEMGPLRFALYALDLLGAEAAPGLAAPATGWNGVALAINVASRGAVDDGLRRRDKSRRAVHRASDRARLGRVLGVRCGSRGSKVGDRVAPRLSRRGRQRHVGALL
jgi:hypothetical protein